MVSLKTCAFTLVIATAAVGVARAQTPLVVTSAELAVPFGALKGQLAIAGNQIVFVASDDPKSSLAIERGDITNIQRAGDVVTITTRGKIVDADGARDTFRFRLSEPADVLGWYEAAPRPAAPTARMPMTTAGVSPILSTYQVKHDHTIGSCQGTLIFTEEGVSYESNDKLEDSRQWKLIDIKKVGQDGVYKLKIEAFRGGDFNFELFGKGIDSGEYRALLDRIARARRLP